MSSYKHSPNYARLPPHGLTLGGHGSRGKALLKFIRRCDQNAGQPLDAAMLCWTKRRLDRGQSEGKDPSPCPGGFAGCNSGAWAQSSPVKLKEALPLTARNKILEIEW